MVGGLRRHQAVIPSGRSYFIHSAAPTTYQTLSDISPRRLHSSNSLTSPFHSCVSPDRKLCHPTALNNRASSTVGSPRADAHIPTSILGNVARHTTAPNCWPAKSLRTTCRAAGKDTRAQSHDQPTHSGLRLALHSGRPAPASTSCATADQPHSIRSHSAHIKWRVARYVQYASEPPTFVSNNVRTHYNCAQHCSGPGPSPNSRANK